MSWLQFSRAARCKLVVWFVEHVFGAMRHMGGKLVRCMGIVRATFALNLKTASYNLQRLVYLKERGVPAF